MVLCGGMHGALTLMLTHLFTLSMLLAWLCHLLLLYQVDNTPPCDFSWYSPTALAPYLALDSCP